MVRLPVAHLVTAVAVFALASAVVGETLRGDAVETIPAPAAASAWNPAPSFDTLTGIATDAQAFIADGVPRLEAIERATESHGLQFQQGLDPLSQWFTDQQLEDCEFVYWFLTDSFVNPCDPWADYVGGGWRVLDVFGPWYLGPLPFGGYGIELPNHPGFGVFISGGPAGPPPAGGVDTFTGQLVWNPFTGVYSLSLDQTAGPGSLAVSGTGVLFPGCGGGPCVFMANSEPGLVVAANTDFTDDVSAGFATLGAGTAAWAVLEDN
jgi:hypothetical protein